MLTQILLFQFKLKAYIRQTNRQKKVERQTDRHGPLDRQDL